jgi:hypothetical protein
MSETGNTKVTASQLQDIRHSLVQVGIQGAATAPEANVLARMEREWKGGVAGYLADNYGH